MNGNMKNKYILLAAAASLLAVASCQRSELSEPKQIATGETTVLTLGFDAVKTTLVEGKTTWVAGDKVRIYSSTGEFSQDVEISSDNAGKASATVEVSMKDTAYFAVYPVESANGISAGKVSIKIPNNPDGRFASANICVAEVHNGTTLNMHNVTSVMKVNVNSGNVVEILQFSAKNTMNGTATVDYDKDSGAPVLTVTAASKSATVAVGGIDGDYYIPVVPGKYVEEFSVTALRGNGGYQTCTSSRENEIVVNTIHDLGSIGNNLSTGLQGEGTEASPYVISNLGEYNAFAASVNLGNPYEGKYVKLNEDISDIQTPVGYYVAADEQFPFAGVFQGENHKLSLNLDGANCKVANYVAAFGLVDAGAVIKDLVIEGEVSSTGNYIAGAVGYARGTSANRISIDNIKNAAKVEGAITVSGISGYATYTDITNCENSGALKGNINVAGICGYVYISDITNCKNTGTVEGTADGGRVLILANGSHQMTALDGTNNVSYNTISTTAVGGISAWTQNGTVKDCINSGEVKGVSKIGGISGSAYWSTISNCSNTASVSGTADFVGGIAGWFYTSGNCIENTNSGAISGRCAIGGIVGMANGGISNAAIAVTKCVNTGNITSDYETATGVKIYNYTHGNASATGGIVGLACEYVNGSNRGAVRMLECKNNGAILAKGQAAGGICGMRVCTLNGSCNGYIDKCVNNGTVECKLYRAGGIIGVCFDRFTSGSFEIRNSENHGTVKAPFVVAGIVSWISTAYPASATGYYENVNNCYNDADIIYDKTAYAENSGPYAGGIVGYNQQSSVYNVFNAGAVKPSEGEPNEYDAKLLGGVISYLGKISRFDFLYTSYTPIAVLGTRGGDPIGVAGEYVSKVKEDGFLEMDLEIAGTNHDTPVGALNEWVKSVSKSDSYLLWKKGSNGPEFDI